MKMKRISLSIPYFLVLAGISTLLFVPTRAVSHCDGLDGPVVKAARKALQRAFQRSYGA